MNISKHLTINFNTIFNAKVNNFLNKSVWKYLISSALIAFVKPEIFGSTFKTTMGIFAIITLIVIVLIIVSSKILANKTEFDAMIRFTENEIIINHIDPKKDTEYKDWTWIKTIKENHKEFWLRANQWPPLLINLDKKLLTSSEIEFFKMKMNI